MTRSAAVTVRRPGLSTAPATSTRTWFQVDAVEAADERPHPLGQDPRHRLDHDRRSCLLVVPAGKPGSAEVITMAARTNDLRDRIMAFAFPRGGVEGVRANRGYTLCSQR